MAAILSSLQRAPLDDALPAPLDAGAHPSELAELFRVVREVYGHDFDRYQRAFVVRRLRKVVAASRIGSVAELTARIGAEPELMADLLKSLALSVTEMFRDPAFYLALRSQVAALRTYPLVRVWSAGCATGHEAYSIAIILEEEGLSGRFQIYGTDIHPGSLDLARSGIIPGDQMQTYTRNYQRAGGKTTFSTYYHTAPNGQVMIRPQWRESILFARHNLGVDSKFNEFNLILCRNVLIYFDKGLHAHVHNLLYESLANFGLLCLGARESLRFSPHVKDFEVLDSSNRIYRKLRR